MFGKRTVAAVLGLGLVAGLTMGAAVTSHPAAAAAPAPATGTVVREAGKITALQAGGFTLVARNHTYTVAVGANTWIVVKQNNRAAQGTPADLKVGDQVSVAGAVDGTDHVAARVVTDGVKAIRAGAPARAAGARGLGQATIQSLSNGTLTLTSGQGKHTRTVTTDAGTVVIKGGLAAVSDLKAGDMVRVLPRRVARTSGTPAPATRPTPVAAFIYVPAATDRLEQGVVKSVAAGTLQVRALRSTQTVTLSASTTFKTLTATGATPAGASDVQAGTRVLVYGPKPATGQSAVASLVLILPKAAK